MQSFVLNGRWAELPRDIKGGLRDNHAHASVRTYQPAHLLLYANRTPKPRLKALVVVKFPWWEREARGSRKQRVSQCKGDHRNESPDIEVEP